MLTGVFPQTQATSISAQGACHQKRLNTSVFRFIQRLVNLRDSGNEWPCSTNVFVFWVAPGYIMFYLLTRS